MSDSVQQNRNQDTSWQPMLQNILTEYIKENKRRRRWGIFFKSITALYILIFLGFVFLPGIHLSNKLNQPHASMVDVQGMIMPSSSNDADTIVAGISKAFKDPYSTGIILRIDSPGGSPVQASYIYDAIMRLRHEYPNKKVYAVCSDLCASAAYYVASAADDIYANPSSLVGSIGVLLNGFGFTGTMEKLGIQRRLITSGSEKSFLDPFSPMKPQDKAYAQNLLDIVHQQFIHDVKQGRGKRLHITPQIFSGLIWTGRQAKELGLIDGFGSPGYVAREVLKTDNIVNYTPKRSLFERLSENMGASFAHAIIANISNVSYV